MVFVLLHTQYGCWEANLGLLQEYYALLTTEQLSLPPFPELSYLVLHCSLLSISKKKEKKKESIKIHLVH